MPTRPLLGTQTLVAMLLFLAPAHAAAQAPQPAATPVPELVLQSGHSGRIVSVAVSPDGRIVATGGADQTDERRVLRRGHRT